MKAECPPGDHSQACVEALDDSVRHAVRDVGEHAVEVLANRPRGLDEGLQARARGPREPVLECALGAPWLAHVHGANDRVVSAEPRDDPVFDDVSCGVSFDGSGILAVFDRYAEVVVKVGSILARAPCSSSAIVGRTRKQPVCRHQPRRH